jgi:NadR type nicotinamide-nucleotide adenylyltransferase
MTPKKIKRIALIGPESTGKTTLCSDLSEHFHTRWVPEYSRGFVEQLNRLYTLQDIEYCTKKQLEQEYELLKTANQFLFSDTELIVAKVWCEDVFNICPSWIEEKISEKKYDLYLLTFPDLPFKEDPARENPHRRDYFFSLYKHELEKRNFDFAIIQGTGNERFGNALKAIKAKFPIGN